MFRSSSRTGVLSLRRQVLVVEDDPAIRALICRMLEFTGHEVQAASSVSEAQSLLRTRAWHVVMCDLRLGPESGQSLLSLMQADGLLADIPVVAVSGSPDAADPAEWQRLGFAGFVAKPFRLEQLVDAIETCLGDRSTGVRTIRR